MIHMFKIKDSTNNKSINTIIELNSFKKNDTLLLRELSDDALRVVSYKNGILKLQNEHITYICVKLG